MRRGRHPLLAAAAVAATLVATAVPALAHATFDKESVPADSAVTLRMRVPLERPGFTNSRIEALLPGPFEVTSCGVPSTTWSCEIDTRSQAPETLVTWSALPAGTSDDIRFDLGLRTPGKSDAREYLIPVIQTYSDGEEARWTHEDGNEPAPRLKVVAPSSGGTKPPAPAPEPEPNTEPASPTPAPTTTASQAEQPPAASTDETVAPTETDAPQGSDEAPEAEQAELQTEAVEPDAGTDATASSTSDAAETEASEVEFGETVAADDPGGDDDGSPVVPVLLAVALVGGTGVLVTRELQRRRA